MYLMQLGLPDLILHLTSLKPAYCTISKRLESLEETSTNYATRQILKV